MNINQASLSLFAVALDYKCTFIMCLSSCRLYCLDMFSNTFCYPIFTALFIYPQCFISLLGEFFFTFTFILLLNPFTSPLNRHNHVHGLTARDYSCHYKSPSIKKLSHFFSLYHFKCCCLTCLMVW